MFLMFCLGKHNNPKIVPVKINETNDPKTTQGNPLTIGGFLVGWLCNKHRRCARRDVFWQVLKPKFWNLCARDATFLKGSTTFADTQRPNPDYYHDNSALPSYDKKGASGASLLPGRG